MFVKIIEKTDFPHFAILFEEYMAYLDNLKEKPMKHPKNIAKKNLKILLSSMSTKRIGFILLNKSYPIGFVTGTFIKNPFNKLGYIDDLFVMKEFRKKGYGKLLIKKVTSWAKKKGAKKIRLGVRVGNPALKMYEKIGFRVSHYELEKRI